MGDSERLPPTEQSGSGLVRDVLRAQNILADVSHVLPTRPDDQMAFALLAKALDAVIALRMHLEARL